MTPKEHTAYHEAGHAVIAFRLGHEIKKVTIVPSRRSLGRYVCSTPRRTSPDDIKIDLAGPLAEALVNPSDVQIQSGLGVIGEIPADLFESSSPADSSMAASEAS
jgi:Peptidase family M41